MPSGLTQILVLYGSGSITNGFILVEAANKGASSMSDGIWLLRIERGKGMWAKCGDVSEFGGNLIAAMDPSFARVGSLLYFTHSHTKIGCIDTAADAPSVTVPDKINTLLMKLFKEGPQNAESPLEPGVKSDGGMLIIVYPDANWNSLYYAVDTSGTILGSLYADKTSITSFDAKTKRGPSITTSGSISFPSIDLCQ